MAQLFGEIAWCPTAPNEHVQCRDLRKQPRGKMVPSIIFVNLDAPEVLPYKSRPSFLHVKSLDDIKSMDIGLHQIKKDLIYQKMEPPFEDLFDPAEEYILNLLLIPWMKMLEQDRATYEKVELVEETRQLDSVYFRKLQALHEESISKKDEELAVEKKVPAYLDSAKSPELPSEAPEEVWSCKLADLTRNRMDLEQFRSFLDQHSASTDLMCWIDIEQFRRMLHKDKKQREDKSKEIKNKYLNKKYFFGPNSPATKEEQEQVMKLGGGWGSVLHDQVPPLILLEIQKYAQMRLEKKWLPLFLRNEESGPQKKMKPHLQDAAEDILIQKREKKIDTWKASCVCCIFLLVLFWACTFLDDPAPSANMRALRVLFISARQARVDIVMHTVL
ncbi:UNVERIFIED_CONTAM: hypothetical protein K2H54_032162 [Gekko kuhli]